MEPLKQITESAELIDPLLESLGGATEKARPPLDLQFVQGSF